MYLKDEYFRLHLGWTKDESPIWISTLRATADHFGWTTAKRYEYKPRPSEARLGGFNLKVCTYRTFLPIGGTRLRICRSPSRAGFPKGLTHSIRVSEHVTNFDLAELAHLTQGNWHWMSDRVGRRLSRDVWLHRYNSVVGARAGAVST